MGKLGDMEIGLLSEWQMSFMKVNMPSGLHLSYGAMEMARSDADITNPAGDIARSKEVHRVPSRRSIHPRFEDSLLSRGFVFDLQQLVDGRHEQL